MRKDWRVAEQTGRQRDPARDHPGLHTNIVRGEMAAEWVAAARRVHGDPESVTKGQLAAGLLAIEGWWREAMAEIATLRWEVENADLDR